jgi:hypothetical protein
MMCVQAFYCLVPAFFSYRDVVLILLFNFAAEESTPADARILVKKFENQHVF